MRRPTWVFIAVALLVLVAFLLRLDGVLSQSLWLDENYTRSVVDETFKDMLRETSATESNSTFFYSLEWIVTQALGVGVGDKSIRVLPLFFGIAIVPVAFLLGRRLRDDGTGLVLAAFAALHPLAVWYGVEARSYGLFLLLSFVTLYFFLRLLQEDGSRDVALWALAGAAMCLAHYFGAFLVAAQLVWLLVTRPALRGRLAFAVGGLALVAVAASGVWAIQDDGRSSYILTIPKKARFENWAYQVTTGMSARDLPPMIIAWLGWGGAALAGIVIALRTGRARSEVVAMVGVVVISTTAVLVFASDFFIGRNMLGLWPYAATLAALGIASIPRRLGAVPAVMIALPALIATTGLLTDPKLQRPDFRGLAQITGPREPGKVIMLSGDSPSIPLGYYLGAEGPPIDQPVVATKILAIGADAYQGQRGCESGALCNLGHATPRDPPFAPKELAPWRLVSRRRVGYWQMAEYESDRPVPITWELSFNFFVNGRGPQRIPYEPR